MVYETVDPSSTLGRITNKKHKYQLVCHFVIDVYARQHQ